jgi:hypothetical protein
MAARALLRDLAPASAERREEIVGAAPFEVMKEVFSILFGREALRTARPSQARMLTRNLKGLSLRSSAEILALVAADGAPAQVAPPAVVAPVAAAAGADDAPARMYRDISHLEWRPEGKHLGMFFLSSKFPLLL